LPSAPKTLAGKIIGAANVAAAVAAPRRKSRRLMGVRCDMARSLRCSPPDFNSRESHPHHSARRGRPKSTCSLLSCRASRSRRIWPTSRNSQGSLALQLDFPNARSKKHSMSGDPAASAAAPPKHRLHNLVVTGCFVAALGVFAALWIAPVALGLDACLANFVKIHRSARPSLPEVALPLLYLVVQIVVPFWASNRFLRLVLRLAGHRLYGRPPGDTNV
jgi:hypothetical protein